MAHDEKIEVPASRTKRIWRFGIAELDEGTLELRISGELTALEPKPMQVLLHLLFHAGEVVTKDELAEACWPKRILSDTVLAKAISRLRDVLQDRDQAIIRTVHGYGYRLVAAVEIASAKSTKESPPKLAFKVGDHPKGRDLWTLTERLGSGGNGEAWLAQHGETQELRVFKFPLDVLSLVSLRREITLSRLLTESGVKGAARILDWNLEQEPYFIECEYSAGGNLAVWAEHEGGLKKIPIDQRIDIAAQIAEALSEAHAVGVIHKDLKPSNVLVSGKGETLQIKLADFGSGGVLDPQRLEALGITRLGFTRTIALTEGGSASPLYLAPEILAGQPATVRADIYALGIILYQLVIGDFRLPLASGWENGIQDEMLREDISAAAAGDPARRLSDASALVRRLRSLESRRQQRTSERFATETAEKNRIALEGLKVRRRLSVAVMTALSVGIVVSGALYLEARKARNLATLAAANSQAVADFLGKDIFSSISAEKRPPKEWTVAELLDAAAPQIDRRFTNAPAIASQLHAALGDAYYTLDAASEARAQLKSVYKIESELHGNASLLALQAATKLIVLDYAAGELQTSLPEYQQLFTSGQAKWGASQPAVRALQRQLIWAKDLLGFWQEAFDDQTALMKQFATESPEGSEQAAADNRDLAPILIELGEYRRAESILRSVIATQKGVQSLSELQRLSAHINLIETLINLGRYDEAQAELTKSTEIARKWALGPISEFLLILRMQQGRLDLERGAFTKAQEELEPLLQIMIDPQGGLDQTVLIREPLAIAYQRMNHLDLAKVMMTQALSISQKSNGIEHPITIRIQVELADILRQRGALPEATTLFESIQSSRLEKLPAQHSIRAEFLRVQGLLAFASGRLGNAQSALQESLQDYQSQLSQDHWRINRALRELAMVMQPLAATSSQKTSQ